MFEGPIRRFLKRSPLIVPSSGELLDASIESIKREKIEEWVSRGVPPRMSDYAITLAEKYAEGMSNFLFANDPDMQKKMLPSLFKAALEKVSEPWISGILRALGTSSIQKK
jgi:hypothetical protein